MWDVGGQDRLRPLWRHYYPKTNALIYVIDSSDKKRLEESKRQLFKIVKELNSIQTVPKDFLILIFANKQDLSTSLSTKEISDYLRLDKELINENQLYAVIGTNALTGQGLIEGLSWVSNNYKH
jgi:ADP-ribosylation factor protein 6